MLDGDAGEVVVGVMTGELGDGVAHRGHFAISAQVEFDLDAAASGVFDGLLGLVGQVVACHAVTSHGRKKCACHRGLNTQGV